MSFMFGDSSDAGEGVMGNIFVDRGMENSRQTSDGGGDSLTLTSAFAGTPIKKEAKSTGSQSHWDSGSSGGTGAGSAPPVARHCACS